MNQNAQIIVMESCQEWSGRERRLNSCDFVDRRVSIGEVI